MTGRSVFYTGIGARKTPSYMMSKMSKLSGRLGALGFVLRSGGANGADSAFEKSASKKEIYLPWKLFNNNDSPYHQPSTLAYDVAARFHPSWQGLADSVKKLMARNVHQILGDDLMTPSDFVVCWTPDGAEKSDNTSSKTGGTGQAIRIADAYGVPVFNLFNDDAIDRLKAHVQTHPNYFA